MERYYLGDTITAHFHLCEYLNTEWTGVLYLKRLCNTVTATLSASAEDENGFSAMINPSDQSTLEAGIYSFIVRLTNIDTGEVKTVKSQKALLLPDPSEACDQRTQYEKDLAKVDEAMRAIVEGGGVSRYRIHTVAGERELERMRLDDLRAHRKRLAGQVDKERVAMGLKPKSGDRYRTIKYCLKGRSGRSRRGCR